MFDSHAHYEDEGFNADREELLNRLFATTVSGIVNIGTNKELSLVSRKLADQYPNMYYTAGIHPTFAEEYEGCEAWLVPLIFSEKCVAIGEIGLDYHYETPTKDIQAAAFRKQLAIASEYDIPVCIHDRDAHGDCLVIIGEFPKVKGLFHSFSGSAEMSKILLKKGWYISFSGVVTFKNASKVKEAVSVVPLDRMLVETDCPYLTPHPFRGRRNDSSYMENTVRTLAEIKKVSFEEMAEITTENAKRFYRIR